MRILSCVALASGLAAFAGPAFAQATSNTRSADVLEYQFNELRGTLENNVASTSLLPAFGTINNASWQSDAGRVEFRGNEPGFGCLGYRGTASSWVHTGWQINHRGSLTIMFWMRRDPASTSTNPFGYAFGDVTFRAFAAGAGGQGITFRGTAIGNVDSGFSVIGTPGVWQHVALVVDDTLGQALWYDNGQPSTNVVPFAAGTFAYSGTRFMAVAAQGDSGLSPFGNHYDMDDFRFYSRALTQPEIQAAMVAENPTTSVYDSGCPGPGNLQPQISANGAPYVGNSGFAIDLSNGEPSRSCALVLGVLSHVGGAYPLDISFLLGPGCTLGVSPIIGLSLGTDPTGAASAPVSVPATALPGAHVYAQYLILGTTGAATPTMDINVEN